MFTLTWLSLSGMGIVRITQPGRLATDRVLGMGELPVQISADTIDAIAEVMHEADIWRGVIRHSKKWRDMAEWRRKIHRGVVQDCMCEWISVSS